MLSRERTDDARLRALLDDAVEDERERELAVLVRALRAEAPTAPAGVREHVRSLDDSQAQETASPAPSTLRRAALAVAITLVLATLVGGFIRAFDGARGEDAGGGGGATGVAGSGSQTEGAGAGDSSAQGEAARSLEAGEGPATLPPSRRRAQDYRAYLRLYVEDGADLSRKTKQALALTRSYGGYVVSVDYDSAQEGMSHLELRVPIRRIQDAIVEYSELGSILGQNVQIVDLQRRIDARSRSVRRLRERIVEIRSALLDDELDAPERERLEAELAERRLRVAELVRERRAVRERARMARVTLELTTFEDIPAAEPRGLEGALRGAGGILLKELEIILYALIVGAPLLLLALFALLGVRFTRRRADERLLERA